MPAIRRPTVVASSVVGVLYGGGRPSAFQDVGATHTLLGWGLHRFKEDAATLRARRRNGQRLDSRGDGAARRAEPAPAAHAILAPHDLVRRPKALDHVSLGFHGSRCRLAAVSRAPSSAERRRCFSALRRMALNWHCAARRCRNKSVCDRGYRRCRQPRTLPIVCLTPVTSRCWRLASALKM